MTSDILTQNLHNCTTRSGYQTLVWWFGNSAGFTTPRRAQAELARLQQYEAPQKQALSLLETLYTQYDSMAEQYESLAAYIKTTFSLEKLNKVIDQLTADLMAVTECHPQLVQQPQAQAVGATAPNSVTLNEVTTSDEWPTVSIPMFPDDEDFCHPDSLGDLWHAQQVQQAQAQAVGATMEATIVESREVAGDSEITIADSDLTTSDKSPAEYAEMYRNGLLSEAELFRLCPLAMPMVAKRTAWMAVDPRADYSPQQATDQFGAKYHRSANGEWDSVTLIDGREGEGYTVDDALRMALAQAVPDSDEIEIEWTRDVQGESDGYQFDCHQGLDADGNSYYRTTSEQATGEHGMVKLVCLVKATLADGREGQAETAEAALAIAKAKPYDGLTLGDFVEDELDRLAHPDSLGDLYRPTHNPPQFYPIEHIVTSRENGYYTLQVPEGHPLATYLEGFITIRHTEHTLDSIGYNVIALKSLLTFPRPKVVKSQISKAITALCHVDGLAGENDLEFIKGVIKKLEALA